MTEHGMNQREIDEMYNIVPEGSRGREADNPEKFKYYLDNFERGHFAWPYAVLCEDADDASVTWHIYCDAWMFFPSLYHETTGLFPPSSYLLVDEQISFERKRELMAIEVFYRYGDSGGPQHFFVKREDSDA